MYCRFCGTPLPEDANFCLKCGKATHEGVQTIGRDPIWEYCQIEQGNWAAYAVGGLNSKVWFYAEAVGPRGKYNAGESRKITYFRVDLVGDRLRADAERLVQDLAQKLLKDGWEQLAEQGEQWYQLRFRRPLA